MAATSPEEEELVDFVSAVLDSVQVAWTGLLPRVGRPYEAANLVLFRGAIESACGFAQSATGPFYCPADRKVYIDLSFYDDLRTRFGAPGDFAQAYVLAHEIGHHVQTLLGIDRRVRELQQAQPRLRNQYSVAMELQADCLAGVWGHTAARKGMLERGDIEEGLQAAAAIGDDRIQRQTTGYVTPDSFTHGSSEQRMFWLRRGLETGDPDACDTFSQMGR
jgi:predicted metalloprotease